MFPQFEHAARKLWVRMDQVSLDEVYKMLYDVVLGEMSDVMNIYELSDKFDYKLYLSDVKMGLMYAPELDS